MKKPAGTLATIGVILALLVLLINAYVSFDNTQKLVDNEHLVRHTHEVRATINELLGDISDAVAAQRGYLLSHDPQFLEPYERQRQGYLAPVERLATLTQDNPKQRANIATLRREMAEEFSALDAGVKLRQSGAESSSRPEVLVAGKAAMDGIRQTLAAMGTEEENLLGVRVAAANSSYYKTFFTFAIATVAAMGMVVLSYLLLRRDERIRQAAAKEKTRLARYNQLLIESTADGIYGVDLQGNCTFVNAAGARLLGLNPQDVLGKHMHTVSHHSHADGTAYPDGECPIYKAARSGKGVRIDGEVFWKSDGNAFPVEYTANPILHDGRVEGVVVAFTDITRRKRTESDLLRAMQEAEAAKAEAEAANVAKSQFLANMSHELRTPLNAVIMYSELLQEEAVDRGVESFVPDLEKIRSGGKHLLALVNGVLDLSKIEAGKMDLYLETFDIAAMIKDVVATVDPLIKKKSNTLKLELPPHSGTMHADLTKVRQILFNLISNAAKFSEKGTITVQVERAAGVGGGVTFHVSDTGIGMSPEQVQKLFQPFTQADASTTRKFGGTGLGLVISKRFCQMMGGDITVESSAGKGSTFTVRLPGDLHNPAASDGHTLAETTSNTAMGLTTVLVIDDEPAVRDLMSRSLSSEGIRILTACDGEEGLRKAREQQPDLIFLDVMMPKMDGWAVLTSLKADAKLNRIPVVMLTIVTNKEMGYVLGASEYLTKPIDRDQLADVIDKYRPKDPGKVVLVVDDDPATRQVLRRTLIKQGWSVVEAENGKVALERVGSQKPSLIMLDLMMPEMDGFEFLAALRKESSAVPVPVVVLTSKDLTPEERSQLTGKVERILQKGAYSREALLSEVKNIVSLCAQMKNASAMDGGSPYADPRPPSLPAAVPSSVGEKE